MTEKTPIWPGWETVRLIGRGSFGAVYEIRRSVFGETERCALKYISIPQSESEIRDMKSEGMDAGSITSSFEERARDIVNEYRLMMQLNDCPNVVHCYDVESIQKDDGFGWDIYIRMELLTPLTELLSETRDFAEADTVKLARDIGTALRDCGRLNIVHRDVKPQNIFVSKDGRYKLGDFGIARISEMTGTATARVGTYSYMAPEVYNGERYGAAADVYSLGMVLYWLLNERRPPFVTVKTAEEKSAALRRRMRGEAIPAPAHGSAALKGIVLKCCAFDPKDRYRSAEELLRELDAVGAIHESPVDLRERRFAPVGAIHESPVDPGERWFAPVGVGVLDDPQTSRPPVTSNEGTTDYTVGAGFAPARGQGERRFAPVGVGAPDDPKTATDENGLSRAPAPTAEDEERTVSDRERRKATPETGTRKTNKKKTVLMACCAIAAVLALILLLPKGGQAATKEPAETTAPTEEPAPEQTLEPTPEPTLEPTPEPTLEPTPEPIDETALAYENALALLENGQYDEAITAFEALGDYEDSAERVLQARYGHADTLAAEGKTYEAARAFYEIKDYRDSWDRCFALWGQITQRETISAGVDHTVGIRTDGTVLAVGSKYSGGCDVEDWQDIVAVSAGEYFTVGLRADGTVVAKGYNTWNQCNVSDWTDIVAISAGDSYTVGLCADSTVVAVGFNYYGQCDVGDWRDIVAVSAGQWHTVGLRSDGTVVAVGDNEDGRCDVGDWTDIVAVSAGNSHTVGLRSDGTVMAVGDDTGHKCEVGDWTDIVAIYAGSFHTVGLRSDGTVIAAAVDDYGVRYWRDIVAVSAGAHQTVGLLADGTAVSVGINTSGKCNVSGWTDIALPEKRAVK
jgi:serine/threonine protein kinase